MRLSRLFKKNKEIKLFSFLILFSLVCLGFSTRTLTFKPAQWGFTVLSVVQRGISEIGRFVSGTLNSIAELRRLRSEYQELLDRMKDYENLRQDVEKIQGENTRLRAELDFPKSPGYRYISAEVIAKDPVNLFETIVVNKGREAGVREGQAVTAFQEGIEGLVGRIVETGPLSSKVRPIYDRASYISARLMRSRFDGLVQGSGMQNDLLELAYVSKSARREIQYGDLVVTSGFNSLYPKDIYLGRITSIHSREWESSLIILLEPVINFSRLEYVHILSSEAGGED
ncbi:MAG: rod shape-determining protein MreC [Spirochaetales bacterium]|jgi:rod shape-determining protein MreC|nr:rod shape-determining protein MreC [Spirochaetales bacterium]